MLSEQRQNRHNSPRVRTARGQGFTTLHPVSSQRRVIIITLQSLYSAGRSSPRFPQSLCNNGAGSTKSSQRWHNHTRHCSLTRAGTITATHHSSPKDTSSDHRLMPVDPSHTSATATLAPRFGVSAGSRHSYVSLFPHTPARSSPHCSKGSWNSGNSLTAFQPSLASSSCHHAFTWALACWQQPSHAL